MSPREIGRLTGYVLGTITKICWIVAIFYIAWKVRNL